MVHNNEQVHFPGGGHLGDGGSLLVEHNTDRLLTTSSNDGNFPLQKDMIVLGQ